MKLADFTRFFREEEEVADGERLERARTILDWVERAYHGRFLDWLDREAGKPMAVTVDHMDLVKQAVRANTLKEVKTYLERLEREASAAVRQQREETDGG